MTIAARVKRAWKGMLARLGLNAPGWPDAAKDDTHATYRTQYETLLPTLTHLPRGVHHDRAFERRNAYLFLAEILDGLHNYGDDPILPPGIRRQVLREQRIQGFAAVEPSGFMGRMVASLAPFLPYILIGGLLLSVTGWGASIWNGWRADRLEGQRDRWRENAQQNYAAAEGWRVKAGEYRQDVVDAARLARATADALEAERATHARAAARERRRAREIQDVLVGSPEPPAWRLRDTGEPEESGAPAGSP